MSQSFAIDPLCALKSLHAAVGEAREIDTSIFKDFKTLPYALDREGSSIGKRYRNDGITLLILVGIEWAENTKGEIFRGRSKIDNWRVWVILLHLIDLTFLVFDNNHVDRNCVEVNSWFTARSGGWAHVWGSEIEQESEAP